ncbi:MAG TPA: SPOR domain-containing protein [Sphingobacteriaceae bacterium]
MDIALYISDLLQQHDEISVSGLGTFYKKRIAARYDEQLDSYLPPSQRVEYKCDYDPNPRLAEYISEQKNISLGSSEHFIEKFAEDIHKQLQAEQKAELYPLGEIHKTNNEYSFISPENAGTYAFGLKPLKEIRKAKISDPAWDPVIINEVQEIKVPVEEPAAALETIEEVEDEPERKNRFPIIIGIILILAAGAAATYFFSPDTIKYLIQTPEKAQNNKVVIPVEKPQTLIDSITVADSIIQNLNEQGFEVDKPKDTLKVSTNVSPANTGTTYEVIVASLNSQKDAEDLIRNFKARGIDARIIIASEKKKNKILISLGSFNTKSSADIERIRIRKDIEPDAYVYIYNKK